MQLNHNIAVEFTSLVAGAENPTKWYWLYMRCGIVLIGIFLSHISFPLVYSCSLVTL